MFNCIKIIKARLQLKKLKKYIDKQNIIILGKPFVHRTKLIDILVVAYLFAGSLKKELKKKYSGTLDDFFKLQAHAIMAADLVNFGADRAIVGYSWKSMNDLIKRIKKEDCEIGTLAKGHWDEANKLLAKIEKETKMQFSKDFSSAVAAGLRYLRKEIEFSEKLAEGNVRFAKSFIRKEFKRDETLAHLTHDRTCIIYEFMINMFYGLFVDSTPLSPEYSKEHLILWAVTLAKAMQESVDDIDDLETDIPKLKPTPIILRIIKTGSVYEGIKDTKIWNFHYLNSLKTCSILPQIRAVENVIRRKIAKRYRAVFRKQKKLESMFAKYFSRFV